LSLREGDLAMREAVQRAIGATRMVIDTERAQVEANVRKYHEKLKAWADRVRVNIDLHEMLERVQGPALGEEV
jgi:hypothetical protein